MAVSCMRHASGHNYRNRSFIVDVAMGQIPRSTERISSLFFYFVPSAFHKLGLYVIPHTSGVIHQLERIFACMIYCVGQTIILTIPFRSSMRGLAYYLSGFAINQQLNHCVGLRACTVYNS